MLMIRKRLTNNGAQEMVSVMDMIRYIVLKLKNVAFSKIFCKNNSQRRFLYDRY